MKPLSDRIPDPDAEPRSVSALRKLGVTAKQLERCPEISPLLDRALSNAKNGKTGTGRVVSFLRYSTDKSAIAVVEVYDEANKGDRDAVPIEALCLKAGADPLAVLGAALLAARNISAQESAMMTIIEHPDVVKATIDFAKNLPGAVEDRKIIHQAVGYLPTSKGGSVNVNLFGGNPKFSAGDKADEDDDGESFDEAFPGVNEQLEEWSTNKNRLLESGK